MLGYPRWRTPQIPSPQVRSGYRPDPELGWTNREGVYDIAAPDRPPLHYTNWTGGRRATAESPAPAGDVRPRWIVVGDSYAYGSGLGDADTFAWRVQRNHPELQVSNYGTPGYGAYQSYLSLYRALDNGAPGATVFYLFNGVHESRNVADPSWIRVAHPPANGVFFPYAELYNGALEDRRSSGDVIWSLSRTLRTVALAEQYYETAKAWTRVRNRRAVTQAILTRMQHAVELAGAKFTVILFDFQPQDRQAYREFLSSRGIAFLDCGRPELGGQSYRQPDGRPNASLNELLAEWIAPASPVARAPLVP